MKKTIVRFLACFIPNQQKRRCFRNKYFGTSNIDKNILVGDIHLSDSIKFMCVCDNINNKKNTVKTMITGSSHALMSFIEDQEIINFGNGSQDLYYQWKLYEKYHSFFPYLKNIIIFYDVFSSGNDMQKGPFYERTALYKILFDIPYKNKNLTEALGLLDFEKKMKTKYLPVVKGVLDGIDHSYPVFYAPSPNFTNDELEKFAKGQIKLNQKKSMHKYLINILNLAKKNNHNVLIVVSPYEKKFRKFFPDKNKMFFDLMKIADKYSVEVLNLYDDPDFTSDDFKNVDHLNRKGAIKSTKKIKGMLK